MSNSAVLQIVQPKFTLSKLSNRDQILQQIVAEVKKISHLTFPTSIELIEYICNLIENLVAKKDSINKETLMIDILKSVFPSITDEEIASAKLLVQYLLNSGAIKKIPVLKYAIHLSKQLLGSFLGNGQKKS